MAIWQLFLCVCFFAGLPTIAVQSSYSLHISACIGYIHTIAPVVSLQMLKPLTSCLGRGLLQPMCRPPAEKRDVIGFTAV